ncbi:hypothetical protein GQ457_12G002980 [Hibiscus cannabinus]
MASTTNFLVLAFLWSCLAATAFSLSPKFYDKVCPQALPAIKRVVEAAVHRERRMGASLLRLHFHDCFVNGCDGSLLLDSTPAFETEKNARGNLNSVRGFEVVDKIKAEVDRICGRPVVSCADILAVAARDSVVALGGPTWKVRLGRRDSTTASRATADNMLPLASMDLPALIDNFKKQGLNQRDLVALSGGHTLGVSKCSIFRNRIYNATNIDPAFAKQRRATCPRTGGNTNLAPFDPTPAKFDTAYFKNLVKQRGLLTSDQALFNGGSTDKFVKTYSSNPDTFWDDFAKSMIKMGNIKPLTGNQVYFRSMAPFETAGETPEATSSATSGKQSQTFTNKKISIVLDECNFLMWKQQVLLAVRSLRLEKLLTGVLTPPSATVVREGRVLENEDYDVFMAQDSALASWLLSTISPQLLPEFVGAETAAAIWTTVLKFFSSRSTTTVMSLHYRLRAVKKGDQSMHAPISDLEKIATILNGLPMEYQPFVAVITASRDPFTLDAAILVLIDAETQLTNFNPILEVSPSLNVSVAGYPTGTTDVSSRPYRENTMQGGRGRYGRMRIQCQLCGKLGHLVDRCWHRFDETFVPVTTRNKDSAKTEAKALNVANLEAKSDLSTCSCHCTNPNSPVTGASRGSSSQAHLASASKGQWFVDSGASHHVSPDAKNLLESSDYSGPGKLTVGNGAHLGISKIGQASLISHPRDLVLHNVLHVPSITKNMVSVSKLAKDNQVFLEFHAQSCVVRDEDTGAVLLTGDEVDGLYRFNTALPTSYYSNNAFPIEANVTQSSTDLYSLWHRRLGHPSHSTFLKVCTECNVQFSSGLNKVPGVEKLWHTCSSGDEPRSALAPLIACHSTINRGCSVHEPQWARDSATPLVSVPQNVPSSSTSDANCQTQAATSAPVNSMQTHESNSSTSLHQNLELGTASESYEDVAVPGTNANTVDQDSDSEDVAVPGTNENSVDQDSDSLATAFSLSPKFYDKVCPQALPAINRVVEAAVHRERRMGASLLRLHFHDCFVNGCDGSLLLDSTPAFETEKNARGNLNSVRGFEVVDKIKAEVDRICGRPVVSCADILAVAARDSVVALGGPTWKVRLGRRDSTTASRATADNMLPLASMDLPALIDNFKKQGLNQRDLVALSGGHTLGISKCSIFRNRIYNATNIDPAFAKERRATCPRTGGNTNLAPFDPTPAKFDTAYFKNLVKQRGLLTSDQALFNGGSTDKLVKTYSSNPDAFWDDFAKSMIKMGNIKPLTGNQGQIRVNCRMAN